MASFQPSPTTSCMRARPSFQPSPLLSMRLVPRDLIGIPALPSGVMSTVTAPPARDDMYQASVVATEKKMQQPSYPSHEMAGETTTASCSKVSLNGNAACPAPGPLLKGGTSSVVLNNYQFQALNSNVGVAALRSALPWAATSSSAGGSSTSSASGQPASSPGTARSSLLNSNFLQKLQVNARTAVKSPSESVGSAGSFGGALGLPQLQTGFVPGRTKLLPRMPWEPEPVMEPANTSVDEEVEAPDAVADAGAAGGDEECEEEVADIKSAVEQADEAAVADEDDDEKVALEEIESPCKLAAQVPPPVVVPAAASADEVEAAESKGAEDYDAPPRPGAHEGTHKSSSPSHHAANHEDDTSRSGASCASGAFAFYQDPGAGSGNQEPVVGGGAVENFEYYSSCSAGANSGEEVEVADVMAGIEISARHPNVTDDEIEFLARHLFEFTDAHELEMHFHKVARYRGEEIYVGKGGSMNGTGVSRKSVRLSYFSEYDERDFDITWPYDLRLEPKPLDQDEKLRAAGLSPSGNKLKPQYQ